MNTQLKKILIAILKSVGLYRLFKVPDELSKNFIELKGEQINEVRQSLLTHYFHKRQEENEQISIDLNDHLTGRLQHFRNTHIPFLDHFKKLKGTNILEIGCGTGSSTIALSEQGSLVTGLDVDQQSLNVAEARCNLYGLKTELKYGNAAELNELFKGRKFDVVIFYASLEHMTQLERLAAIKSSWSLLDKGGLWCVFGSPNRLWHTDEHTSSLPFYMWLPDDLAIAYSRFSTRSRFNQIYKENSENVLEEFARWGRGISFHELELAIKPAHQLKVAGSLRDFTRRHTFLQKMSYHRSLEYKFKMLLSKVGPQGIHTGFYENYLDLIIEKD